MDRVHLVPAQLVKREISKDPEIVWHPALLVAGCRRHHGQLDTERTLKIPRSALPEALEEFAKVFGLQWWISREYGER